MSQHVDSQIFYFFSIFVSQFFLEHFFPSGEIESVFIYTLLNKLCPS